MLNVSLIPALTAEQVERYVAITKEIKALEAEKAAIAEALLTSGDTSAAGFEHRLQRSEVERAALDPAAVRRVTTPSVFMALASIKVEAARKVLSSDAFAACATFERSKRIVIKSI